ncbi:MAG: phosphate/phosphite/phosphonate ABC transporter substrate-binding protein [Bdellovibrionaceae bacterium]|nr:phosphate/phosphite/phosphonate ABC transporter substrate-binding protein [Pseudobdellovibrionaceae bacterium]MDW8190809.1 phosphate/phosphite/phosphonate ABC transporter substrate-binding protein [Pseudobdellovibrionaceae bacterium]
MKRSVFSWVTTGKKRGIGLWGLFSIMSSSLLILGCTSKKQELGSVEDPIKFFFTPSVDVKVIEDNSKVFQKFLEENTPYKFKISTPGSYIAVVEAFGTKKADVAVFTNNGYLLANEKYGAEARLTVLRHGSALYKSQFIVRADSGINSLKDLEGKKLAFVDPASTSGYLLPLKTLKDRGIKIREHVFAGKHDNVVTMVYNKQVDAGATFWSPEDEEGIQDARRLVKTQFPDVAEKVKILELTDSIPNDPIVFRKELPEDMKKTIEEALLKFIETKEGKEAFKKIYGVDGLKKASDADYASLRAMLKDSGQSAESLVKK